MNDVNEPIADDSTAIVEDVSGGPAPEHKTPETRDDAISKALDEAEATKVSEAADDGADDEAGAAEPDKPAKAKTEPVEEADDGEQDDGVDAEDAKPTQEKPKKPQRPTIPPPEKFDAAAKEHWPSVPHVVRADIDRVIKEYEGEAEYYRPAVERYNAIREYDELAARNGVDLRQTLAEVKNLEDMMEANPLAALNAILLRSGPRKADGQPVSLFEMASHIVQMGPDGYQQAVTQRPQQQQQVNPEVEQLKADLAALKADQTRSAVIAPFAQQNPRFNEPIIQQSIAQILKTGMVDPSLPAHERLAAAYDMAVRLNPSADVEADEVETQEATPRRVDGNGGSRSVRGAPPSRSSKGSAKRVMSRDEAITSAMAALR